MIGQGTHIIGRRYHNVQWSNDILERSYAKKRQGSIAIGECDFKALQKGVKVRSIKPLCDVLVRTTTANRSFPPVKSP